MTDPAHLVGQADGHRAPGLSEALFRSRGPQEPQAGSYQFAFTSLTMARASCSRHCSRSVLTPRRLTVNSAGISKGRVMDRSTPSSPREPPPKAIEPIGRPSRVRDERMLARVTGTLFGTATAWLASISIQT